MTKRIKSPVVERMDDIQRLLTPSLKQHGFRRKERTFTRFVEEGMAHVIALQAGPFEIGSGTYGQPSYYGKATINLGIYIKECMQRGSPGHEPRTINDAHCTLRTRLSHIEEGEDRWFDLGSPAYQIVEELLPSLIGLAIPFLDRWPSRDSFVAYALSDSRAREHFLYTAIQLDVVTIYLARGHREAAQQMFDDYLASIDCESSHGRYVVEFAKDVGLTI